MTICDNCIHDDVCGIEGHLDEAMIFCANKVSDVARQSVRRGRWEHNKCTECKKGLEDLFFGEFYYDEDELNFCPNCGADLRGGGNEV